ncbi:hypothetical protein HMPREF9062_0744 [Actinomyces sp. oral taxon 448 str. F0400]|nr:hypothetical protein HMPREF9062_0744 [Actinomyces sp. oral taxon 448 str. F0400]
MVAAAEPVSRRYHDVPPGSSWPLARESLSPPSPTDYLSLLSC